MGLPDASQGDPDAKSAAGASAQPKPGAADPQATAWSAAAQPTQHLDPTSPPTQMMDATNQPTQRLDPDYPTELLAAQEPLGALPPPVLAPPNPSTKSGTYPGARWFHGATALVAWAALILQLALVVADEGVDDGLVPAIINYFSLFAVLANIVVAFIASALAMNPIRQSSSFAPLRLDSVVMITMSTLMYVLVLEAKFDPQGWQAVANVALYYVVPLLAVAGYFIFGPRPRFSFRDILPSLVIPAIWVGYTLLHGALAGWYPYSFIDAASLGYGRVAVNLVWMLVATVLVSVALILLDKKLPWAPRR